MKTSFATAVWFIFAMAVLIGVLIFAIAVGQNFIKTPINTATPVVVVQAQSTATVSTDQPPSASATVPLPNRLIVFSMADDKGNGEIYSMKPDGGQITKLTNNSASEYSPAWSPDGKRIAFISERSGKADIYVMNADGSDLLQLTTNPGSDGYFIWSPDGTKIAYLSSETDDPNSWQIITMQADGSGKTKLTGEPGSYLLMTWSPNSQQIVYVQQDLEGSNPGKSQGYLISADGSNRRELIKGIESVRWQDKAYFYATTYQSEGDEPTWQLYKIGVDGTAPQVAGFASHAPIVRWFDAKPSATFIVKDRNSWVWRQAGEDSKSHSVLATWTNFAAKCQKRTTEIYSDDVDHLSAPDGMHELVLVDCDEGQNWFYLVNADGSEIKQLLSDPVSNLSRTALAGWSPDGQWLLFYSGSMGSGPIDFYLLDVKKALDDPTTQPIRLTTDGKLKSEAAWQPGS